MDTEVKDYIDIERSRVTSQFEERINIDNLLQVWTDGFQELQKTCFDIFNIPDIDTAKGYQLDVIGEIVGQPRDLVDIGLAQYFGFEDDVTALPYGSVYNKLGGIYFSLNKKLTGNVTLTDQFYRYFIKAKIVQNTAQGSPEDIISTLQNLFQAGVVEITQDGIANFTVNLDGRPWSDPTSSIYPGMDEAELALKFMPKPAGVSVEFIDVGIHGTEIAVDRWKVASDKLWNTANYVIPDNLPPYLS